MDIVTDRPTRPRGAELVKILDIGFADNSGCLKGWCMRKIFSFKMYKIPIKVIEMHFYKNFKHILCIKREFCMTNLVPNPWGWSF